MGQDRVRAGSGQGHLPYVASTPRTEVARQKQRLLKKRHNFIVGPYRLANLAAPILYHKWEGKYSGRHVNAGNTGISCERRLFIYLYVKQVHVEKEEAFQACLRH